MAFQFYPQAQSNFKIPLIAANNAFLGDVLSSDPKSDSPISAGFFRLEKGDPLTYTYKYDEMKIFLDGDYTISDGTGQRTTARPGDVVYFPKGSTITFETEHGGLAFFVGQRQKGDI